MTKQTTSSMFATARIYALLSIVSAHLYFLDTFEAAVLSRLSTFGVILFLFMAGYFFRPLKFENFGSLCRKKWISICIPWFFLGSLTFLYKALLSPSFRSVAAFFRWMIGYDSYLYYLPVLLFCFLICYKAPKICLWLMLPITVCSLLLTAAGVLGPVLAALHINNYLNPFNWIGFFALGMLAQGLGEETLFVFFKKSRFLWMALFVATFSLLLVFREVRFDYFSFVAVPFELLGAGATLGLSTFTLTHIPFFKRLSDISFSTYLIHMIFIGLLDEVLAKTAPTRFLSSVIIIAVCFAFFFITQGVAKRLHLHRAYEVLLGVRE